MSELNGQDVTPPGPSTESVPSGNIGANDSRAHRSASGAQDPPGTGDPQALRQELARSRRDLEAIRSECSNLRGQCDRLLNENNAIKRSVSWRLTAPVRWLHRVLMSAREPGYLRHLVRVGLSSLVDAADKRRRRLRLMVRRLTDPRWHRPEIEVILKSGLFDPAYYLRTNPDVAGDVAEALNHYLLVGSREGRDPHPLFDGEYYVRRLPELEGGGTNPLAHFILGGGQLGVKPHPLFDPSYYLGQNPDAAASGQNPLSHYLTVGEKENHNPSRYFDVGYYRAAHGHLLEASDEESPLVHFVTAGWKLGLAPARGIAYAEFLRQQTPGLSGSETYYTFFDQILEKTPGDFIAPHLIGSGTPEWGGGRRPSQRRLKRRPNDGAVGLTFFGPWERASGLGQAARGYLEAIREAGIAYSAISTGVPSHQLPVPSSVASSSEQVDWPVAVTHANAADIEPFLRTHRDKLSRADYRIAGWVWELSSLPSCWFTATFPFDEIWAPSTFCQQAIQASTDIPVFRIPYVVEKRYSPPVPNHEVRRAVRQPLGISDEAFCFLYIFDASSYPDRKNPFALVRAFCDEFAGRGDVALILKMSYSQYDSTFIPRLQAALGEADATIVLVDKVLPEEELTSLIAAADCYVSPHRSEGFGLTLAEAMLEGKPVIGTAYGGVTDFLTEQTGYPVDYTLVEIESDLGPYRAGFVGADPSVAHLRERMRQVVGDRDAAARRAECGRSFIASHFSRRVVGEMIAQRLRAIYGGGTTPEPIP